MVSLRDFYVRFSDAKNTRVNHEITRHIGKKTIQDIFENKDKIKAYRFKDFIIVNKVEKKSDAGLHVIIPYSKENYDNLPFIKTLTTYFLIICIFHKTCKI